MLYGYFFYLYFASIDSHGQAICGLRHFGIQYLSVAISFSLKLGCASEILKLSIKICRTCGGMLVPIVELYSNLRHRLLLVNDTRQNHRAF